jgi:uncharacterized membrane protein
MAYKHARRLRRNVHEVAGLERDALNKRSIADRFSDTLTQVTGSTPFALVHLAWFVIWLILNSGVSSLKAFDPFPFSLLTLLVSLEAIFLTVFVLMSQNRMTHQADRRAEMDLQVDMLAEQELTLILYMLRRLCQKQGVRLDDIAERLRDLLEETDVHDVASRLDVEMPS